VVQEALSGARRPILNGLFTLNIKDLAQWPRFGFAGETGAIAVRFLQPRAFRASLECRRA
jgi:hypothetical protein